MPDNHIIRLGNAYITFRSTENNGVKTPHQVISRSDGVPFSAGAGTSETAQRVIQASDDPLVAALSRVEAILQEVAPAPRPTPIAVANQGDNTLVAAPSAGNAIRLFSLSLIAASGVTIAVKAGSTKLMEAPSIEVFEPQFHRFDLPAATALVLNLSAAVNVYGYLQYKVVAA